MGIHPEQLTLFPVGSHNYASRSVLLGSAEAKKMTVTSGRKCLESYKRFNQDGSSPKTLLISLLLKREWYSSRCVLIWKMKGTKFNRLLFQLALSTPRTDGTEYGLLRTPDANMERGDHKKETLQSRLKRKMPLNLNDQLQAIEMELLPTPRGRDWKGEAKGHMRGYGICVNDAIQMLLTPQNRDWKGKSQRANFQEENRDALPNVIGTKTGMKLQPNFVEWMQGFPTGWTDLKHLETQ